MKSPSFSCAGFLESINNMLTSGMVPALFPDDEKEAVLGQVWLYTTCKVYSGDTLGTQLEMGQCDQILHYICVGS